MKYYKPLNDIYLSKQYKIKGITKYSQFFIPERSLLTCSEIQKLSKTYYNFNIDNFKIVDVKKNKTYQFFGIRTTSKENIKE